MIQHAIYFKTTNRPQEHHIRALTPYILYSEELKLIRERVQRNQLTGSESFVDEVEQRIGLRIESRRAGRPKVPEK